MKRTEGNIGETDKTSVKVHHAPGGQSNFSLGWGNDNAPQQPQQPQKGTSWRYVGKYHNQSSIVFGEEPQKPAQQAPKAVVEVQKPVQQGPGQPGNGPTNQATEAPKTSVKVHNPPGGKSSITFGWLWRMMTAVCLDRHAANSARTSL